MIRIIVAALSAFIGATQLAAQSTSVIIRGASIVDMSTGAVQPAQTVIIEGNRIAVIGPQDGIPVPRGALVVDGTDAFLIPGLWDMHVHATIGEDIPAFFPLFIANGVTGIRDAWGSLEGASGAEAAVAAGKLVGPPRVVAAGALIDGPARIWPHALVALTPADGVRLVDSLHAAGAPFLKVYSSLMPPTFFAIAERARTLRLPFVGHVPELVSTGAASSAGMRSMEHLSGIVKGCSSEEDSVIAFLNREVMRALDSRTTNVWDIFVQRDRRLLASQDEMRCRTLAARLARNQTWQVPTLVTNRGYAMMRELAAAGDERLRYVPAQLTPFWTPETNPFASKWSADSWETTAARYARELQLVPLLARAGVPILAGTDTPNPWAFPGFGIHDELALLVEAGLTPLQALQAATINPARFLGRETDMGTVAVGKLADLVLLNANPLTEITNTRRIRAVVADGRVYSRAEMDALLVSVAERNRQAPSPERGFKQGWEIDM
jgi:imidazolonepropionase-like amidohydrolase